jgi:predicted Zn-dependent protease
MKYRNPRIPEGINVSDSHPLKELLILAGGALLLLVLLSWLLGQFGGRLARLLPFEKEAAMAPVSLLRSDAGSDLQVYLDRLGDRLGEQMDLPDGMLIHFHVNGNETFNAFATLGGNILLYRGLLERLPHENALAMLLAHEMAHIAHRDPIAGIGQGLAIQGLIGLLLGDPNLAVLGSAGIYTQLHYTREMERSADAAALNAVHDLYGHIGGAEDLFRVIRAQREYSGDSEMPAIFSSHPLDAQRLEAIAELAQERGWTTTGEATPLPLEFGRWMAEATARATDAAGGDEPEPGEATSPSYLPPHPHPG